MSPPPLQVLSPDLIDRILGEAYAVLADPGIRVLNAEGLALLQEAGARVAPGSSVASVPETLVHQALASVPREFSLYDRSGMARVRYGGPAVHFDPGSAAVHLLDPQTGQHREAVTADLVRLVKVAEVLTEYDAQSTALICSDVAAEISDLYRLYLVLLYSEKPIVTGAFRLASLPLMEALLAAAGDDSRGGRPRAIFDVCPSPPLTWTEFAAHNLIALARAQLPVELVSMPLAGATAPATLLGAVVQHAAECLSGLTLHQLAGPGTPIVWGGAPSIFDMRHGTTAMGAMETAMLNAANAQIGQHLKLPTHGYLCTSDAKGLDAQAGLESGQSVLIGALAGINMISGAGMLDFLACQSLEKLVLDAEAIGSVRRLLAGFEPRGSSLAAELFAEIGHSTDFLGLRHTREWFRREQHMPSSAIDRASLRAWLAAGQPDAGRRAAARVNELLARYQPVPMPPEVTRDLRAIVERAAREVGMDGLPEAGTDW